MKYGKITVMDQLVLKAKLSYIKIMLYFSYGNT